MTLLKGISLDIVPQESKILSVYDSAALSWPFWRELRRVWQFRDLLAELVVRNIRNRYRRSLLGVAWSVLNPLLTMIVLTVVFSRIFRFTLPKYPVYLLSGLLVWTFFSQSTTLMVQGMVWGSSLLKHISVPPAVFALAAVGSGMVNLLLSTIPLVVILAVFNVSPSAAWLFLPVAVLLAAMFTLGIGMLVSTIAVYFADVVDIYQMLLLICLYLTPVFYPREIVPDKFAWLLELNPVTHLVACFRDPLTLGILPNVGSILAAATVAISVAFLGWLVFSHRSDAFARYV